MKQIFVRSPYTISINESNQLGSRVELFVWNEGTTEPTIPSYTFTKDIVSTNQRENVYNISNEIREYILTTNPIYNFGIEIENETNYCFAKVKRYYKNSSNEFVFLDEETFACLLGYTSFLNGANQYENSDIVPLFNPQIKIYNSEVALNYVNVWLDASTRWWYQDPSGLNVPFTAIDGVYKIPYSISGQYKILKGTTNPTTRLTFNVQNLCEPKYTPLTCSFINRFGGWSFLTFFKAHQQSIEVKSTSYNLMPQNWNYNTFVGANKNFNYNGTQKITCNTGWVDENYFELIQDLLVSETILLDNMPVICKTQSSAIKTNLKDRNINYTIEFDFNFNLINDVI